MREAVREREFREFAEASQRRLRRVAYLLCGDWHLAQDFTQTTLMKLYSAWGRVRLDDNVNAYAHSILTRTFIDHHRRATSSRERVVAELPDTPGASSETATTELRLVMLTALEALPPHHRAVLVLRFWEDWSVEQTASILGLSPGTVKSHSARGLARLRALLEQEEV